LTQPAQEVCFSPSKVLTPRVNECHRHGDKGQKQHQQNQLDQYLEVRDHPEAQIQKWIVLKVLKMLPGRYEHQISQCLLQMEPKVRLRLGQNTAEVVEEGPYLSHGRGLFKLMLLIYQPDCIVDLLDGEHLSAFAVQDYIKQTILWTSINLFLFRCLLRILEWIISIVLIIYL
jgi:hypothetical protein